MGIRNTLLHFVTHFMILYHYTIQNILKYNFSIFSNWIHDTFAIFQNIYENTWFDTSMLRCIIRISLAQCNFFQPFMFIVVYGANNFIYIFCFLLLLAWFCFYIFFSPVKCIVFYVDLFHCCCWCCLLLFCFHSIWKSDNSRRIHHTINEIL